MKDSIKIINDSIKKTIIELVASSIDKKNLDKIKNKHLYKIHFIPIQYRILGGILQGLNIKFGNFLQKLLCKIILQEKDLKINNLSGQRVKFHISNEASRIIDEYMTKRERSDSKKNFDEDFTKLLKHIDLFQDENPKQPEIFTKDIDILFETKTEFVYLELKYNDDHDTGKHVDINRKIIKTYAGLKHKIQNDIKSDKPLTPILYFFNPFKRYLSNYLPDFNVKRGDQLFNDYFSFDFKDLEFCLSNISQDKEILDIFHKMYKDCINI